MCLCEKENDIHVSIQFMKIQSLKKKKSVLKRHMFVVSLLEMNTSVLFNIIPSTAEGRLSSTKTEKEKPVYTGRSSFYSHKLM